MPENVRIQGGTCSIYVTVTILIKINLCCVPLDKHSLFINKLSRMASIKIGNLKVLAKLFSRFLCYTFALIFS
jgi:hypothetical protein